MIAFLKTWPDMGWSAALLLGLAAFLILCVVVILIAAWRETPFRIDARDLDSAHRTGMFTVGRDAKDKWL